MDLEYFKDHIAEELDGACDYIRRAIEIKPMEMAWASHFVEMSAQELNHAQRLFTMFNEYCTILGNNYPNLPDYIKHTREEVVANYTEMTAKIKHMQESYK